MNDFNDIFDELNIKENNISELINSEEAIEKIVVYSEKYNDDLLDLREDIKNLENEYQNNLDKITKEQEEANRKRIKYIMEYNEYNREITSYIDDSRDQINYKLIKINNELKQINQKEQLLNGHLSRKMLLRKKELEQNKEILLKDRQDYNDLKKEAYNLAKKEEDNIKKAQNKRNELINELVVKKIELYKKQSKIIKVRKKYNLLKSQLTDQIILKQDQLEKELIEIQKRLQSSINSNDLNNIAVVGIEYSNFLKQRNQFYHEHKKIFKLLNIKNNKKITKLEKLIYYLKDKYPTVSNKLRQSSLNWDVNSINTNLEEWVNIYVEKNPLNSESVNIYSILWDMSYEETKKKMLKEINDIKSSVQPTEEDDKTNEGLKEVVETNEDNKSDKDLTINPILWYEKYKEQVLYDTELSDDQVAELIQYIEQLKQEFIWLFASFARIDNSNSKIEEALKNTVKLVEKKKTELLLNPDLKENKTK